MLKDKVAFIGLGACGSNIALLFQKKHYHTLFINGSEQDNKALAGARNILKLTEQRHKGTFEKKANSLKQFQTQRKESS